MEQGPNLKLWHAEKIDLKKSFICFAFANLEIFGFKVGVFKKKKVEFIDLRRPERVNKPERLFQNSKLLTKLNEIIF